MDRDLAATLDARLPGLFVTGANFDVIPEIALAIIGNLLQNLQELRHGSPIVRASAAFGDDARKHSEIKPDSRVIYAAIQKRRDSA
jgi:hypothetical protein